MVDAQAVDIGIVGDALLGKVLTKIGAVRANGFGQLGKRQVVTQIEAGLLAMFAEQTSDGGSKSRRAQSAQVLSLTIQGVGLKDWCRMRYVGSIAIALSVQFLQRLNPPQHEADNE